MIKLAANAALMARISFINEIANVCEATGADVVKVAEGIGWDRRIGKSFLRAGIGFGGSCFPKDSLALKQLAASSGYHFQVLNAVIEVNELQKRRVIGKLKQLLGSLRGKRVALLGLAFKPNTDDTREAPAFVLGGPAPCRGRRRRRVGSRGASERRPRRRAGRERRGGRRRSRRRRARHGVAGARRRRLGGLAGTMRSAVLIDGRNMLEPAAMRAAGFHVRRDRAGGREASLMEAIVLAGGKAERLGDAAAGLPKSLVPVGGRPLLAWQIGRLRQAGVDRVIVSCFGGQEHEFDAAPRRTSGSRSSAPASRSGSGAEAASASPHARGGRRGTCSR